MGAPWQRSRVLPPGSGAGTQDTACKTEEPCLGRGAYWARVDLLTDEMKYSSGHGSADREREKSCRRNARMGR